MVICRTNEVALAGLMPCSARLNICSTVHTVAIALYLLQYPYANMLYRSIARHLPSH